MTVLPFSNPKGPARASHEARELLSGFSIEVMPRTAAKIPDFRKILPPGTRVYIAQIEGTPFDDMLATARRLQEEGFTAMPHLPARQIRDRATLETWLRRYREEAGVREALVIAGGGARPVGAYDSSLQLLETGLFDALGFTRLHVAGHPEGSRDIDPDGSDREVMAALRWKAEFAARTDAKIGLVTQFAFDPDPVLSWARRLAEEGVALPVHVGLAGPTKLHTLIKFAVACGVGPSLGVLQKRARDLTRLATPFTPDAMLAALSEATAARDAGHIAGVHLFPLGGLKATAEYATDTLAQAPARARG
ncbi:methylenetetrahydrofolate reductase [Roseivivax sp. GX 12232]|uniref:methylenetetrahydrofolate reductase n=1 Tax=Roseivivax sp. GX 12232 TaxID=2900547 RepID=UPI001E2A3E5B|nr:methylenetetrahydrofolate reductase [Roseivivax sp. GX 12232]MCE0507260.1 methylenetetrahydrofolate reductase [Roseivivax sp. GX 12232]